MYRSVEHKITSATRGKKHCHSPVNNVILTMMMMRSVVFSLLLAAASAVPAIVWKSENVIGSTMHTSEELKVTDLLSELKSGISVIFLLSRGDSGDESLTVTAPLLSQVSTKEAFAVHQHVTGIQSGAIMVSDVGKLGLLPLLVNLNELALKLNESQPAFVEVDTSGSVVTKAEFKQTKRARALDNANVLVVSVAADTAPEVLDAAVVDSIEHAKVEHVILSAVRSVDEVKHERNMAARSRFLAQKMVGQSMQSGRRLEGAAQDDKVNNNGQNMSGVYYVSLTPNILAGILFFLLFSTVTWIGISCMGMISGQDVFVTKMPTIGREA